MAPSIDLITNAFGVDDVRVTELRGDFGLNRPYRVTIDVLCRDDAGLDRDTLHALMNQPCAVRYGDRDGQVIHGRVRAVQLRHAEVEDGVPYRLELVPSVFVLDSFRRSRIFQDLDLPGLVRTVLGEAGLTEDADFDLTGMVGTHYPTCEYIVQYEESDWALLNRWLEHWGVHYHFAQRDDRACVVFGDTNGAFRPYPSRPDVADHPPIPWLRTLRESSRFGVHDVRHTLESSVGSVLLRDYNWRTPHVGLELQAAADPHTGVGFHYAYGEHFKDPAEGQVLASIRGEELAGACDVVEASASVPGLYPGMTFRLEGHPLGALDRAYLVVDMRLTVSDDLASDTPAHCSQELTLRPVSSIYRPPRRTPKPRIDGVMHGRVDGAFEGTAAPIDEDGRYKVLFPFDLIGNGGGRASRWIRVAQPSSGPGYGMHFPLHVGAEVMVAHVGGDPDRPVIVGSPHNTLTKNPVTTMNPTQSQLRTQAGVRIVIDDDC